MKLYAIYTPHITDYIYQQYYRKYDNPISTHNTLWDKGYNSNRLILESGEIIKDTIAKVRKIKSEQNKSLKDTIEEVIIICPTELINYVQKTKRDLLACTNADKITYQKRDI